VGKEDDSVDGVNKQYGFARLLIIAYTLTSAVLLWVSLQLLNFCSLFSIFVRMYSKEVMYLRR